MSKTKHYLAYIAGLVASDGTIIQHDYRVKIVTSNKLFANKIKNILEKLGYRARIHSYKDVKKYEVYVYSKNLFQY